MPYEELEQIGLSKTEVKVYLALLELGSSGGGKIADKSGVHRRAVYDALSRLIEKGMVSFSIQNGVKRFQAANPEKIQDKLLEKEQNIKKLQTTIQNILPELLLKYNEDKDQFQAKIYQGKEGLKTVMELILKENDTWLSIGSTGKGTQVIPFFLEHWHKRRIKQKIKLKTIVANNLKGKQRGKEFLKMGLAEVKLLPKSIQQPQTLWIFGDKVAIILVSIEKPVLFLVENVQIAKSFREYFNWIWNNSSKLL